MNDSFQRLSVRSKIELISKYLGKDFESFLKEELESTFKRGDIITDGSFVYLVSFSTELGIQCQLLFNSFESCSGKEYEDAVLWFTHYFDGECEDDFDEGLFFINKNEFPRFHKADLINFSKGHTTFASGKLKKSLEYFVSIGDSPKGLYVVESKVGEMKVK